jgi:peptide/nickel transport system permease protein
VTRFVLERLSWAAFVTFLVVSIVFVVMYGIGDACVAKLGPNADPDRVRECRESYGFDQPLWSQYASYLGITSCIRRSSDAWHEDPSERGRCGLLQGDLGESILHGDPVAQVVLRRLPRTLFMGSMAIGFEILIGVTIGILAAIRRNTWFDTGFMATAFLGISAPTFLTGLVFLYFFAFRLGWFPVGGYGVDFWDHVGHAVLPAITLAIIGAATYARIMRGEMIENLRADFVRTARAKGVTPARVVLVHAARNALLPIVTLMGLQLRLLVSGAIILETIFAWPGVGRLAFESIDNQDAYTVMGVVIVISIAVQLGNLLADVAVASLDPRVRLSSEP